MTAGAKTTGVQAHLLAARSLHQSGQLATARQAFEQILRADPRNYEALHTLGVIAAQTRDYACAAEFLARATEVNPRCAAAYSDRGVALKGLRQWEAALESFSQAIALDAGHAQAYANRGNLYWELHQWDAALADHERAIAIRPAYAEAHYNRGLVLNELGRSQDALASYDRAIAIRPTYANAFCARGVVQQQLQQLDAALASFDEAIRLIPEFAVAHCNRAYLRLLLGDFDNGWEEFEWRARHPLHGVDRVREIPVWTGEQPLRGKTILLYAEQGLGDTLQFCRYAELVARLGAAVVLEVPPTLVPLMEGLDGVAQTVANADTQRGIDYCCPLMSLPRAFRTNLATIPANTPYLKTDSQKVQDWRARLGAHARPRVGLAWSGGYRPMQAETWAVHHRRNLPLARFQVLGRVDVEFFSLQKGQPAESELTSVLSAGWDGPALREVSTQLQDFSDTAALIENLDLVISVDTSVVHLAAALGKPVWLLNRFDSCWRWLVNRGDSPWYPSLRIYRQDRPMDWDTVLLRVTRDLDEFARQWTESSTAARIAPGYLLQK